jgi:hypothetical protein
LETPTASGRQSAAKALLRSLALLSLACGGTVTAAPCADSDCDLRRADSLLNPLTVRPVDLADAAAPGEAATPAAATESLAPLLFLTPRVTSILEDVFEVDPGTSAAQGAVAAADDAEAPAAAPLRSPVAETGGAASGARHSSPETDQASVLPKYQRQMYRTDI